ncbi:phospholipase D family protein, partial [Salmonella enterica subsp. enterica serovar Vitkin]|nr:phospholipase D family protein [Salmonella enterica subsp. enterica serovar Vitkin]ECA1912737.1 phospholipase D family protein [Salmonella enterica subsp. enterica serovar Vitkin]
VSAVSRNAENALLVQHSPELAKANQAEFNRLWNESAVLTNRY